MMSNWVHQVLTVRGEVSAASELVERAVTVHERTCYLDDTDVRESDARFFLEDRNSPQFCIARSVSTAIPDAVVTLTWIEPINVWSGSVSMREGRVLGLHMGNAHKRVEWAEPERVLRQYSREFIDDPHLGDFVEVLESEEPSDDIGLPNCDVCDGTDSGSSADSPPASRVDDREEVPPK